MGYVLFMTSIFSQKTCSFIECHRNATITLSELFDLPLGLSLVNSRSFIYSQPIHPSLSPTLNTHTQKQTHTDSDILIFSLHTTHTLILTPPPSFLNIHTHRLSPSYSFLTLSHPHHTHTQTLTFSSNGPESIARGKDGMTRGISFQGEGEESPQVRDGEGEGKIKGEGGRGRGR